MLCVDTNFLKFQGDNAAEEDTEARTEQGHVGEISRGKSS